MALVRGSKLSASQRLTQAVDNFTSELSPEQRDQLQKTRDRPPGIEDVMNLTAEIDRLAATQITEFRRCYGPRITSFLDGVQEFAKVADIGVGAAKSTTASAVWTAVRFLLLAGTQAPNPYIDKLSALFLSLGRSTHRFRDMAILYPRSPNLRNAVFDYYIVIVDMCCEILKLSKKKNLARYWTAFAKESYTTKLDSCAKQIMEELSLENNRMLVEDSRENSIWRIQSKQHMQLQKHHRRRLHKKQLLDACSKHDYKSTWRQARNLGTTLLFDDSKAYREWKQSRKSCTMSYHGKLGSGKSVLLANIVDDLYLQQTPSRQVVYFFCKHDLPDSLLPRTILGCIARQLLQSRSDLEELADSIPLEPSLSMDNILDLIKKSTTLPVFLVLSGTDACLPQHRDEVLQNLQYLQQHLVFNVCISTRESKDQLQNSGVPMQQSLTTSMPEPNPDIESYIEHQIDECLKTKKLVIGNTALIAKVKTSLRSGAEGMFLWVYLQITCLCLMESDHDIEQSLESLPSDLAETYSRILKNQAASRYRNSLFELIMVAQEPLTTSQLHEALSIEAGNTKFDPAKVLNSIERVIKSSAGLVVVDEEEDTVRFVHHSAADFLTSSKYESQINPKLASSKMTHNILTYLNYSLLETQLIPKEDSRINVEAVPSAILMSMIPGASKIINPSRARARNLNLLLTEYAQSGLMKRDRFLSYAKVYWLFHVMDRPLDAGYLSLLKSALSKGRIHIPTKYLNTTPLQESVIADRLDLVSLFLDHDLSEDDKEIALCTAAIEDKESKTIDLLVSRCLYLTQENMLCYAVVFDSPATWQAMLKYYPKINTTDLNKEYELLGGLTPLVRSVYPRINLTDWSGIFTAPDPKYAMKILLETGSIYSHLNTTEWSEPLTVMHPRRMTEVLLNDTRVDPLKESKGMAPMFHAVTGAHLPTIQLLTKYYHHQQFVGPEMERKLWDVFLSPTTKERSQSLDADILGLLLETKCLTLGCSMDKKVWMITPLMRACQNGMLNQVRAILQYDSRGVNTPVRLRTSRHSDSQVPSWDYSSAWDMTTSQDIRTLLEEYGGRSWLKY